jgi:hypothetical protein
MLLSTQMANAQQQQKPDVSTTWFPPTPAATKVFIETPFGTFNVPLGYLSNRLFSRPYSTSPHSFDPLQRQSWYSIEFNFWYPDGGWVWHENAQIRKYRPIEPGHMNISDAFVIKMFSPAEFLDWANRRRAHVTHSINQLDVVLPAAARSLNPNVKAFQGVTLDAPKQPLHFHMECESYACGGWLTIHRRNMTMRVSMPSDAISSMFSVLKLTSDLLDAWEADAKKIQ